MKERHSVMLAGAIVMFFSLIGLATARAQMPMGGKLPPLKIISPANGATVSGLVAVIFETPADLSKMTMSMQMSEKEPHLHLDLDKRVMMPAMKQLTQVGKNRYRFSFGGAVPGRHTIRVYWADAKQHKPMGMVRSVTITVK